jgi:hypothetical protein
MDPFAYKMFVMIVLVVAQGILWAWVGLQAQRLPWWPVKVDLDLVSSDQSTDTKKSTTSSQ